MPLVCIHEYLFGWAVEGPMSYKKLYTTKRSAHAFGNGMLSTILSCLLFSSLKSIALGGGQVEVPVDVREKQLQDIIFNGAKLSVINPMTGAEPEDDAYNAALTSLTAPGSQLLAIQSAPFGLDGVRGLHFFMQANTASPSTASKKPELDEYARKLTSTVVRYQVHFSWIKLLAKRLTSIVSHGINNRPGELLISLVISNFEIGALVAPADAFAAQAFLHCSAFALQVPLSMGAIQTTNPILAVMAITALTSSYTSCATAMLPIWERFRQEEHRLEAERAGAGIERPNSSSSGRRSGNDDRGSRPTRRHNPAKAGLGFDIAR